MTIDKRLTAVNFTKGGNSKLGVCIHTMVGTLDGTDGYFRNINSSQVSAHYGVDLDGSRVFQWVEENDQAHAQGIVSVPTFKLTVDRPGINPNTYLISIECADGKDPAGADRSKQLPVIVDLVRDICKRNNIPIDRDHICGHREIRSTKTCPGNLDVDQIVRLAKDVPPAISEDQKRALEFINSNKGSSNFEGAVREWYGAMKDKPELENKSKQLDGFIAKWIAEWRLSADTSLVGIESEMSKLLLLEDRLQEYRDSIEGCVGSFPDDLHLLEAHSAVRSQMEDLTKQIADLQRRLLDVKAPNGYKYAGVSAEWRLWTWLFKTVKYKKAVN